MLLRHQFEQIPKIQRLITEHALQQYRLLLREVLPVAVDHQVGILAEVLAVEDHQVEEDNLELQQL